MFEINVYGEIVSIQDSWIEEAGYFNLSILNAKLTEAAGKPLLVKVHSPGGDVEEGFAIYSALRRYAKDHNVTVTTRCDGRCDSIATVIFLSGDVRIVNRYLSPFVHNAWTYAVGDSNTLMRVANDLKNWNLKIATFYSDHTDLTIDEASELMTAETAITPDECKRIRFATEVENIERPKALKKFNKSLNINKMANKKKAKGIFAKLEALLEGRSFKDLIVYTDTNEELDFPDLLEGDSPKVEDKATYKGEKAEGTFKLADGLTQYKFEDGILKEIIVDEPTDDSEEIADLKAQIADLKGQVEAAKTTSNSKALEKEVKALKSKIESFKALASEFKVAMDEDPKDQSGGKKASKKEKFTNFKIKK